MKVKTKLLSAIGIGACCFTFLTGCCSTGCCFPDSCGYYDSRCGRYSCTDPNLSPPTCSDYYSCSNYQGCGYNCIDP